MGALGDCWDIAKGMKRRMENADLSLVSAGVAFFTMLSMFPALAAAIAITGLVANPSMADHQLAVLKEIMPVQAFTIIEVQVRRLIAASSNLLGWATLLSTLAALWSARRGTDAMIKSMNRIYGIPLRGGVHRTFLALLMTFSLVIAATIQALSMVVIPILLAFLPLGGWAAFTFSVLRHVVAIVVAITGIWLLYRFAPGRKGIQVRWLSYGTILALVVWAVISWAFSYYLRNFGSYADIYGSIGAVIALLMFLYFSVFAVLLGATLNAELEQRRTPPDPTDIDEAPEENGMTPMAAPAGLLNF